MRPTTEAELAEIIRTATGPLSIEGGGTRRIGPAGAGTPLDMGGLSGISLYEPGALTIVTGAGTPLADVEAALAAEGQRLPFEVPDLRGLLGRNGASTMGGVVSANASGPRRIQAGACRDSLIGIRFVSGEGDVIKNGGRVMKNVTGYDLVKLLAGARGSLGALSEVSFKVLPRPETQATLISRGLSPAGATAAMAKALGSPFEVTGAAYESAGAVTALRIEGMEGSVRYRQGELARLLGPDWEVLDAAASAAHWALVRDVSGFAGKPGAVWRISVKPSDMPVVLTELGSDVATLCDWGGGLIWALVPLAGDGRAAQLRGLLARIGGHATLLRGAEDLPNVPVFHPEAAPLAALSEALRRKFDPKGLFGQPSA
jgi:glycolate oxidase FAD binding subunit